MLDVTKLTRLEPSDVTSLPAGSILAVEHLGAWTVVIKRAFDGLTSGWSVSELTDQAGMFISACKPNNGALRVYDPSLGSGLFETRSEIGRILAVGDEPESLGRIVAWNDLETGRSSAILVSVNPRRWRGSGCAFTHDDSLSSFLEAVDATVDVDSADLRIYSVPLRWS